MQSFSHFFENRGVNDVNIDDIERQAQAPDNMAGQVMPNFRFIPTKRGVIWSPQIASDDSKFFNCPEKWGTVPSDQKVGVPVPLVSPVNYAYAYSAKRHHTHQ